LPCWQPGDALLAGGTWLFSEPQNDLSRLVDLVSMGWQNLRYDTDGLEIGATCTFADLEAFSLPPDCIAAPLFAQCCRALLGSFKVRSVATVGGNLCLALAAGPMAALLSALDGICTIWTADGIDRKIPVRDFVVGANANALQADEVLRAITVPAHALRRRTAYRQMSLSPMGRSAALLVGTRSDDGFVLTITAAVAKPVQLAFGESPDPERLARAIEAAIPVWYDDVHGAPDWRRRITHIMACEIAAELGSS
jgi:CO/xanthine dehydrogenase FAD-binding subunit